MSLRSLATDELIGRTAHYITPIKRKPAHPEGSFKRNIPILKNINAKRFWSDRANLNMNKAVYVEQKRDQHQS